MSRCGQALVEFAMAALITLLLILGVIEFSRIMVVYSTLADAARLGARWAVTHGTIPGETPDVSTIEAGVQAVVQKFLAPGTVNIKTAVITTSFPNLGCSGSALSLSCTGTSPGNAVQVSVSYPYDLLVHYFPLSITLSTTSEGVFTW